jgi:hypothetical protein
MINYVLDHLILLQDEYPVDMKSVTSINSDTSKYFYNIEDFIIPSNSERYI